MGWIEALSLALIQGLTEFLPVSSSAHLILPSQILGWDDQGLAFDVAVHVGTLAAVLLYFRREVFRMGIAWSRSLAGRGHCDESRLAWLLLLQRVGFMPFVIYRLALGTFLFLFLLLAR